METQFDGSGISFILMCMFYSIVIVFVVCGIISSIKQWKSDK